MNTMARHAIIVLTVTACASTEAQRPEPTRNAEGLPVTGRARYDAYFQEVRRLEAQNRELSPQADALSGPVAVALELPLSAPTHDLAAALGKSVKRCTRAGIAVRIVLDTASPGGKARIETVGGGAVPPALQPGFEAVAKALSEAQTLHPRLEEAVRRAEALREQGLGLERTTPSDFSGRGSAYARAVSRELADAEAQVEAAWESLRRARDHVGEFLTRLPGMAAAAGARVLRITPRLTSR